MIHINKKRVLVSLFIIIIFWERIVTANVCHELAGTWQGKWQDHHAKSYGTKIIIYKMQGQNFKGKFLMSNHEVGPLEGRCRQINRRESFLVLKPDPPWYNPCRGHMIKLSSDNMLLLHVHCYKPNQSGFFSRI